MRRFGAAPGSAGWHRLYFGCDIQRRSPGLDVVGFEQPVDQVVGTKLFLFLSSSHSYIIVI